MDIYEVIKRHGETITSVAEKMGVTRPSLSISLKKPSYTTLERIASALNVEPWQLLAPSSVVEELKQARAARDGGGAAPSSAWCVWAMRFTPPTTCSSSASSWSGWSNRNERDRQTNI